VSKARKPINTEKRQQLNLLHAFLRVDFFLLLLIQSDRIQDILRIEVTEQKKFMIA